MLCVLYKGCRYCGCYCYCWSFIRDAFFNGLSGDWLGKEIGRFRREEGVVVGYLGLFFVFRYW